MTSAEKHYSQQLIPEGPRFLHAAEIEHSYILEKGSLEPTPYTDIFCREFVEEKMIDEKKACLASKKFLNYMPTRKEGGLFSIDRFGIARKFVWPAHMPGANPSKLSLTIDGREWTDDLGDWELTKDTIIEIYHREKGRILKLTYTYKTEAEHEKEFDDIHGDGAFATRKTLRSSAAGNIYCVNF